MRNYLGIGFIVIVFVLSFLSSLKMYAKRDQIAASEKKTLHQVFMSAPLFQPLPTRTAKQD